MLLEQIMKKSSCNDSGMRKVDLKTKFTELSFNAMTMVMVGRRFYGEDVVDQAEAKNLREVIRDGVELSAATNLGDFLPFMQWMDITGLEKKMVGLSLRMDKFLQGLLEERRKIMAADYEGRDRVRKLMIDNLLSLQETEQKYYTDDIIKGIIMVRTYVMHKFILHFLSEYILVVFRNLNPSLTFFKFLATLQSH